MAQQRLEADAQMSFLQRLVKTSWDNTKHMTNEVGNDTSAEKAF